jgi:hypothetical protein
MMERISFQASVSKGWLHDKGGFVFDEKYYKDPLYRQIQDRRMNGFIRKEFPDYPLYNMEANLMQAGYTNENQVLIGGIQPNLILAVVLGSKFVIYPDKDSDVSGNPLQDIAAAEELPGMDQVLAHPSIQEFDAQILELKSSRPELEVIPPFFWDNSGRATIHGIITTSLKLIGDNAMILMIMDPGLMHAVHQWIADVYIMLIKHFSELAGMPVTSVHVGECSGTMISNEQYGEFVTPYVTQLGKAFGNIRLHSCGLSDHILDAISLIENLAIIDTGSNTSVARIREMKGADFEINLEPPVNLMLKDSSKNEILQWLDRALEENRGGPIKFAFHLESGYAVENCLAIYDELRKRKLIRKH